jgi:hypothetical protein
MATAFVGFAGSLSADDFDVQNLATTSGSVIYKQFSAVKDFDKDTMKNALDNVAKDTAANNDANFGGIEAGSDSTIKELFTNLEVDTARTAVLDLTKLYNNDNTITAADDDLVDNVHAFLKLFETFGKDKIKDISGSGIEVDLNDTLVNQKDNLIVLFEHMQKAAPAFDKNAHITAALTAATTSTKALDSLDDADFKANFDLKEQTAYVLTLKNKKDKSYYDDLTTSKNDNEIAKEVYNLKTGGSITAAAQNVLKPLLGQSFDFTKLTDPTIKTKDLRMIISPLVDNYAKQLSCRTGGSSIKEGDLIIGKLVSNTKQNAGAQVEVKFVEKKK